MGTIDANQCRPGTKLLLDGELYTVQERAHHKPGKGGAFVRFKLKGIITGKVIDHTVRAGTKMESADVTTQPMQYPLPSTRSRCRQFDLRDRGRGSRFDPDRRVYP